ncbi:MAG: hypothetical protein JW809_17440 [Pirellulales bacterium]|nr:hypothetical protein [Pirellulales bacterium]
MVRLGWLLALVGCWGALGGCGRRESADDLGTVVFEIPKVPGSNLPYTMPELESASPAPPGKNAPADLPNSGVPDAVSPDAQDADEPSEPPNAGSVPRDVPPA